MGSGLAIIHSTYDTKDNVLTVTKLVSRPPVRRAFQCRFVDRFPSERASAPHRDLISSPV